MRNSVQGIILLLVYGVFGDEVKSMSVYEGEPVTLHTDTVIKNDDKIYWRFGETHATSRLVQMIEYKVTYEDSIDGRFRDRLQISDTQSGDLTIKNMRVKFSRLYEAEIDSDTGTSYKRFNVTVKESPRVTDAEASDVKSVLVTEGESVTLPSDEQTQKGDLILWRFGDKNLLIAKGDMEDNNISYVNDDVRFRNRLKMNDQTGDLTITNIINTNAGVYKLKIITSREPKYKTFSVSFSGGPGLSSDVIAGLCVFFLLVIVAVIAAGVILYRRMKQPVMMKVTEGDRLTLHAAGSKLQPGTQIKWKFNGRVIMTGEMTKDRGITKNNSNDQQFTSRLKWNRFIGDLIINAISQKDAGIYEVNITYNKETSHKRFKVNVTDAVISVYQGDTVILHAAKSELQTGTQIEWKYNGRVIMTGEMTEDTGITEIKSDDQQFKNRLELDNHVGSLIISNISNDDTGLYEVNITKDKQLLHFKCQVNVIGIASFDRLLENMPVMMKVREGDPLTLSCAGDCELLTGAQIEWTFKDRVIMTGKMTEDTGIVEKKSDDQQFKNRLELHHFVGSLTIMPVSKEDSGFYEGKITYNGETIHKRFYVNVTYNAFRRQVADVLAEIKVPEGDRLTLNAANSELKIGARIVWKFKDRVIMTGVMTEDTGIIEINCDDPQFSDRLQLEYYHGYLIINNISRKDIGLYEGKIINNKKTSCYKTQVNVIDNPIRSQVADVRDSARTYRNDPGVDIPLLKKV